MEKQTTEEYFEDQLDHIDALSNTTLDNTTEKPKPKMTRSETKATIISAVKKNQISKHQGMQLLKTLGFVHQNSTKKLISDATRTRKRKQQKKARKTNRR